MERNKIEVWKPEDARTFLEVISEHPLGSLSEVAILSGMRRGELCWLRR